MTKSKIDRQIEEYVAQQTQALLKYVREEGRLAVVKAPPGSGKTYLLMQAVRTASKERQRIAIPASGNARTTAVQDLVWSLYNKVDFIFNY